MKQSMKSFFSAIFFSFYCLTSFAGNLKSGSLRFLNIQSFPTGTRFFDTEWGGLSGLTYDPTKKILYAVSDDRSNKAPARFYQMSIENKKGQWQISPSKVVFLQNEKGEHFSANSIDPEAIALGKDGQILISSEGDLGASPLVPFWIGSFLEGQKKHEIPLASHYVHGENYGPRNNLVFESIATTPDQQYFFFAPENSLEQDGPQANSTDTTPLRVQLMHWEKYRYSPKIQWAYPLSPIPIPKDGKNTEGDNGLVEIVPFDSTRLLALERSYLKALNRNVIKIFSVSSKDASDISSFKSLKNAPYLPLQKTLLLDLDKILPQFPKEEQRLDNFEGMALGPMINKNEQLLILVSDNNFNPGQRTLFLFLAYNAGDKK